MNFKKTLCGLMAFGTLSSSLIGAVGAKPMKNIFDENLIQGGTMISTHVVKLQEFIKEEKNRLALEGGYFLENLQRLDSLVFGIFCCFCYKNNLTGYIEQVVRHRVPAERREDMDVLESILRDNPEQSKELYERFEIGDMSSGDFSELVKFVKVCAAKTRSARGAERRKPGRQLREEIQRGLREYQSGYDADY